MGVALAGWVRRSHTLRWALRAEAGWPAHHARVLGVAIVEWGVGWWLGAGWLGLSSLGVLVCTF